MESVLKQNHPKFQISLKITEKSIFNQYLIIILWIVAAFIIAFYLVYDSVKYDLIYRGILPTNYDFLLIIAAITAILGFILLLVSKNHIKDETK